MCPRCLAPEELTYEKLEDGTKQIDAWKCVHCGYYEMPPKLGALVRNSGTSSRAPRRNPHRNRPRRYSKSRETA